MRQKAKSAKAALIEISSQLGASSFFNGLALAGVMIKQSYLSTTGSGEEKYYWIIGDNYLVYGNNKKTLHEFKTEPVFYMEKFNGLLVMACEALLNQALDIRSKTST